MPSKVVNAIERLYKNSLWSRNSDKTRIHLVKREKVTLIDRGGLSRVNLKNENQALPKREVVLWRRGSLIQCTEPPLEDKTK